MVNRDGGVNDVHIPPQSIPPDGDDKLVTQELRAFSQGLDLEAKAAEHRRREALRDMFHGAVSLFIAVGALIMMSTVVVWAYHMLAPAGSHWLTKEQMFELQKVFSGALLAVVVSDNARKYF